MQKINNIKPIPITLFKSQILNILRKNMYNSSTTKIYTKGFLPRDKPQRDTNSSKSSNHQRFISPEQKVEASDVQKDKQDDSSDANVTDTVDMHSSKDSYGVKNANFERLTRNNREDEKDGDSLISFKAIKSSNIDNSPTNSYGLQLKSPKNYFSNYNKFVQSDKEIQPMTARLNDSESTKKIFTETRPQLSPQAMPKLLKFKFDDKTLRSKQPIQQEFKNFGSLRKYKEETKNSIDDSEDCNIEDDEENVIDDSEEQSIFVMNPTDFIKSKALFQKAQEEIQTYAIKPEVKYKNEEIEVNITKQNLKERKHSSSITSRLTILQEYYDKMNDMTGINKTSSKQRLPYCYQLILNETTEKLTSLNKSCSSMHNKINADIGIQLEINNNIESSIHSLREKNNDLNVSLSKFKEKSRKEKRVMQDTINNLNEKVDHLLTDLKLQLTSFNKVDTVRQNLTETLKELQMEKEELEKENEEYINTINELKTQIENVKPVSGGHDEFEHCEFSQTKTKGTFSDKDDSQHRFHLEERKSNCCIEHIEKAKLLEKQNQELECELRKMMNISKQDTSNLSEIINQSLDVLNDISITIEVMAPVSSKSYSSNQLTISSDKFDELTKHKNYLMEKYIKNSSFTERIEVLETARERMKLLMKSVNNSKSNFSNSKRTSKSKALSARASEIKKPISYDEITSNNLKEMEQLIKLKDVELQQKLNEIKELEETIMTLKIVNEKNQNEISELNNLVSKHAAEKYITDPSQYLNLVKSKQTTSKDQQNIVNMEDDADHSLEYSPGEDVNKVNKGYGTDEDSLKLEISQSVKNPFGGGEDQEENHFERSPFIEDNRRNDYIANRTKNNLQSNESNHLNVQMKSANRKKWDKGNNSKNTQHNQINLFTDAKNDSGDDEDDSSFIINFNDLESPGKYRSDESDRNHLNESIVHSRDSQVKLDMNKPINYDTNREVMLQYIHAVSCTLEDYLME